MEKCVFFFRVSSIKKQKIFENTKIHFFQCIVSAAVMHGGVTAFFVSFPFGEAIVKEDVR